MPHGCRFNDLWLEDPNFKTWIKRNEKDPFSAECKVCRTSIVLKTMGKTAITSHMKGKKHNDRLKFNFSQSKDLGFFLNSNMMAASTSTTTSPVSTSNFSTTGASHPSTTVSSPKATSSEVMKQFVSKSDTLKAEIWWCVGSAVKNHSFSSNSDLGCYLKQMFPDVPAVDAFSLGETKSMHLTSYGLAPHLKSILLQDLQSEPYTILFDESLNRSTMSKQLDVHIRCWASCSVTTRYLNSFMLGHAKAQDLVESLNSLKQDLNFANLTQISMDGPNVNWCAYEKFAKQLEMDYGTGLVNIGSCGLHQVHTGYRAAISETNWNIDSFLNSIYYVFKDIPARRADYTSQTKSTLFPLKFAAHRWVENQKVLKRAKEILPFLQLYIEAVRSKKVPDPKTQTFATMSEFLTDKLLPAKLIFLINMCKPLENFLTLYQKDTPLVPFLYKDLHDLLEKFIKKIVKPSLLEEKNILEIDVSKTENLLIYTKIKIGVEVEEILKEPKLSQKQILDFKMDCLKFVQTFIKKMIKKSPLNYSFTKYLQCLSPNLIADSPSTASKYMKSTVIHLKDLKVVQLDEVDDILEEFEKLCQEKKHDYDFKNFNHTEDAVDQTFHTLCSSSPSYKKLWPVIKRLLVISHGQASVERGFSCNKEVLETNMQRESLVAKRIVKDYVLSIGGAENFSISPEMLKSCSLAHSRYNSALMLRKEKQEETRGQKRKALEDSIGDLKKRKVIVEETRKALEAESDEKGDKAEREKNLKTQVVLFSQANALRKAAKEKKAELEEIERALDENGSLLKSM